MTRIGRAAGTVAAALALVVASPVAANAGTTCSIGPQCGVVRVDWDSDRAVNVTQYWPARAPLQLVQPGSSSTYVDTDGYYAPSGCTTYRKYPNRAGFHWVAQPQGWNKITNLERVSVKVLC